MSSPGIITYPLGGITYDAEDAAAYFAGRTSGVYSTDIDFAVAAAADGSTDLTVSAGQAWMHVSRWVGLSVTMREAQTLTLPLADSALPRIDRVVLRYDATSRSTSLQVLQGTPSSEPAAPAISRTEMVYDLCLAEVSRPAGQTALTTANLTDTRADDALCGLMRDGVTGIPTGLTELDQKTGGLQDSDLIVIAARPSVGKTAFALHLARSAAMAGNAVAVYSLEMQGERLADRWLAAASNINPYRWRNGIPTSQEMENAHTAASELSGLPIYVDDSTSVSMDHIRSSARLLKSRNQCDAIIIDYLQLCDMATKQANRNREQEVAQATRKAKLLAKELHIPVVLLSQLNRESENRPGGRPELAHLRESGAIEQDADVIMFIYRDVVYNKETVDKNLAEIIVAKQRNGPIGTLRMTFLGGNTRFEPSADAGYWGGIEE